MSNKLVLVTDNNLLIQNNEDILTSTPHNLESLTNICQSIDKYLVNIKGYENEASQFFTNLSLIVKNIDSAAYSDLVENTHLSPISTVIAIALTFVLNVEPVLKEWGTQPEMVSASYELFNSPAFQIEVFDRIRETLGIIIDNCGNDTDFILTLQHFELHSSEWYDLLGKNRLAGLKDSPDALIMLSKLGIT